MLTTIIIVLLSIFHTCSTIKNERNNINDSIYFAEETTRTSCNITTQNIQTSANASITRQLRGICTSRQLDLRFQELEIKIMQELEFIKHVLNAKLRNSFKDELYSYKNIENYVVDPSFLPKKTAKIEISPIERVTRLNNTIETNCYYYFWTIKNVQRLMNKEGIHVSSPTFLVLGHQINIYLYPNQPKGYLTVKLRASRSFVKKHKFFILQREKPGRNIESETLERFSEREVLIIPFNLFDNCGCKINDEILIELNITL